MATKDRQKYNHEYYLRCGKQKLLQWRQDNKEHFIKISRNGELKRKYGLSDNDYTNLLIKQSGLCAICGVSDPGSAQSDYLSVDHDHDTGQIRGLLCHKCNRLLGDANDGITILKSAISYLEKYNAELSVSGNN